MSRTDVRQASGGLAASEGAIITIKDTFKEKYDGIIEIELMFDSKIIDKDHREKNIAKAKIFVFPITITVSKKSVQWPNPIYVFSNDGYSIIDTYLGCTMKDYTPGECSWCKQVIPYKELDKFSFRLKINSSANAHGVSDPDETVSVGEEPPCDPGHQGPKKDKKQKTE